MAINIQKTTYKVAAVSIHLNTIDKPGFAQIDAIGISEKQYEEDIIDSLIETEDFDSLEIGEEMAVTTGRIRITSDGNDVVSYKFIPLREVKKK